MRATARPNANLATMNSLQGWATTAAASSRGRVVDQPEPWSGGLAATGVDWTGARATLNVGDRFTTYTRTVANHTAGSGAFDYGDDLGPGPGAPAAGSGKWGQGGRYWLSGKLGALDAPGEWFIAAAAGGAHVLYVWSPDSQPPGARVSLRVKDYCIDVTASAAGHPVVVANLSMHGCTFRLRGCVGCTVSNVELAYPSYDPDIRIRDVPVPGAPPNVTLVEGNRSVVERVHVRWSNNNGLKIVGNDNLVDQCLIEDVDWLATLDFPALEIGFGVDFFGNTTAAAAAAAAAATGAHNTK